VRLEEVERRPFLLVTGLCVETPSFYFLRVGLEVT
jgi:hypothetical protein